GRFHDGVVSSLSKRLYNRPMLKVSLKEWEKIAEKVGVTKAELAYRWVTYDSPVNEAKGDAVIFGGSSLAQVEQNVGVSRKAGLSEETKKAIDGIWESVKDEAPLDNVRE
ncbi:hypothetical protein CC80DRAFT_424266, partial [Byssothecium circinans]